MFKSSNNPVDMKIGMRKFKGLKDRKVLIEAHTKDEIEMLHSHIQDKCGDRLDSNVQERRNTRLTIYSISDEVTLENAADIICT
jgi:hypothetical protein